MKVLHQTFCIFLFLVSFTLTLYAQDSRVVLFETFTNSFDGCPTNNDFDAAFKSTLSANGSKVIHLNYHIIQTLDPMALASIPQADSAMMLLSGLTKQPFYISCGAVDRTNFPQYKKLTGTIPGGKTQWDQRISDELKIAPSVSISLISAQIDTISSSKTSRLIAVIEVKSNQVINDSMGLHFAITQDNVPFAQCPSVPGPTKHNNVVRYITNHDSLLTLRGKPSGSTNRITYVQDISKTKDNFYLRFMKLIAFVHDIKDGDFQVAQAAMLQSNFENLPPPPATLTLNSSLLDGKTFAPDDPISILFDKVSVDTVKVEFSSDNGATWQTVGTTHDFIFYWNAANVNAPQAKIRISSLKTGNPISTESGTFSIVQSSHSIGIIHPNSFDTAYIGKKFTISWNAHAADSVNIYFSSDAGTHWGLINVHKGGTPIYSWYVSGPATTSAEIKIEGQGEAIGTVSISDPFSILNVVTGAVHSTSNKSFAISINPQPLRRPGSLNVNIQLDEYSGVDISLYDLAGKKVFSKDRMYFGVGDNSISLDLNSLPAGTYILQARSDSGELKTEKIEIL
jgi:hypothetical protein